jgi:hypothetical protein
LWISGDQSFQQEVEDFDSLLSATDILHTFAAPTLREDPHAWESGWVSEALSGLYQNSIGLGD